MANMKLKKGDNVIVIAGKDKGKAGKILVVDRKKNRVIVEGVNMVSKHTKPSPANQQGGIIKKEAAMDSSNVMIFCDKCGKGVRIRKQIDSNGNKSRVCAVCGANLDK